MNDADATRQAAAHARRSRSVTPPKALVLGIDGGSLDMIEELVAEGALPVLGSLLAGSAYGVTSTTWPAHTAPGWSSFVTARQPGGHGVYQFFDTQAPDYGDRLLGTEDFGCSTMWEWLARQGLSVGLINVPMSHPPRNLPGYQLTWPLTGTLRYSSPPQLLGEMARAGVSFRPDVAAMFSGDHSYLDFATEHVRARGRSVEYLLRHRPVDVVMAVITEIDRICHHYWHFADGCHPRHARPERGEWAHAVRLTYQAIDEVFGEIIDLVGDEVPVLLLSDHGFGQGRYNVAVNVALEEAGLLRTRPAAGAPARAGWFDRDGRTVDFAATRAYMPTPGCSAVNLNLAGRQRDGLVGLHEVDEVLTEVSDLLLGLRAPDTGRPVFSAALPAAQAYPGRMSSRAPDLLLLPADEGVLASPGIGGPVWSESEQTGLHRYAGMWALRAEGVPPGRRDDVVAITDLAPTLVSVLGLRFPAAVAGRPLTWLSPDAQDEDPFLPDDDAVDVTPSEHRHLSEHNATAEALSAMGYL